MFDVDTLRRTIALHGPVARIVIASVEGSSPREVGASMLVWAEGQSGTIGGGALEWQAIGNARAMLPPTPIPSPRGGREVLPDMASTAIDRPTDESGAGPGTPPPLSGQGAGGTTRVTRIPLGPALGQCCGGAVTLLTETYATADDLAPDVIARPVDGRPMPLSVKRLLDRARAEGARPAAALLQGWFIEPVARPTRHLWVWGAGHVGRAIVAVMAPLPDLAITWVDIAPDRFPDAIPPDVTPLPAADPAALVPHAPPSADHLILTYSHALDLDLCHRLLTHGFHSAGLIGSATKWARFRSRLAALGHAPHTIARITCPIGDPSLGKHPQAIALGVAAAYLAPAHTEARQEFAG